LVLSVIANWQAKTQLIRRLFVKTITVRWWNDVERLRPAPQGRAHRIRKRSNHVTIVLDLPTHKAILHNGTTNPIGNRLVSSEDGTQTGMVEMITVINLPKITKSESISMLVYQKLVYLVIIERTLKLVTVTITTARPGII
jgi:hypothetical protein